MITKNRLVLASSIVLVAVVTCTSWLISDTAVENDPPPKEKSEKDEDRVLAVLNSVCPKIAGPYQSDIARLSVEFNEQCSTWDCTHYSWNKSYIITIKISDRPFNIPKKLRLAGHTVKFEIGSGNRSGVAMSKGARLCGLENLQTESGSNIIVDSDLAKALDYKTSKD